MIKLADIAETRLIQWVRETAVSQKEWFDKTTISQKIALGAGVVLVVGIVSYGGYTVYGNQTGDTTPITQNQPTVETSDTKPAVTATTPVVTEAVAPAVVNNAVESHATTSEVTSTEGVDYYYDTENGGRSEYVEEETYYEPEPSYSEPESTYTAPEPTYTAPATEAPANDWSSAPVGDTSGDWGEGAISN